MQGKQAIPSTCLHTDIPSQDSKHSRTGPPARDIDPLRQTAALLALDIHNVRVAAAAAPHAVLLGRVKLFPVLVLLLPLALVERRHLEVGLAGQLAGGRVGGAVLDGGVAVAKVAEVVDVAGREEGAGGEGVDRRVAPLLHELLVGGTG